MPSPAQPTKHAFGERQLAAVVFTDVAGFSRLMETNETRTLVLIQRDLKLISTVCNEFGGEVLKNTGDGCLATFRSVESAVRSALKIQQIITDASQRFPSEKILHHRIGIHLGDIFFGKGDVLGNGVNIAARLLGEAEPDGICISQAVYDVVKHRQGVKAVCIGARELKNIRESMPVYRLLLGAAAQEQAEQDQPTSSPSRKPLVTAISAALIVIAAAVATWQILRTKNSAQNNSAAPIALLAPTTVPAPADLAVLPAPTTQWTLIDPLQIVQQPPSFSADSAASWDTFPKIINENLRCAVEENSYAMSVESPGAAARISRSPWGSFDDVTIQATARIQGTPAAWWAISLVSAQGRHRVIRIDIGNNGVLRFDLTRLNGVDEAGRAATNRDVIPYFSAAIRRAGNSNTLILFVHDRKLSAFVNGQPIGTPVDISPLGSTALQLAIGGQKGSRTEFDELRVWVPHSEKMRDQPLSENLERSK
jgi:class 3 adenylate cyclase